MTLYELTNDYMNLLELAEDPDIDEQAWPLFTPAYWGSAIIEGDDRFKASQVTTIQALSIGSRPIFPFTPFTPFTPSTP